MQTASGAHSSIAEAAGGKEEDSQPPEPSWPLQALPRSPRYLLGWEGWLQAARLCHWVAHRQRKPWQRTGKTSRRAVEIPLLQHTSTAAMGFKPRQPSTPKRTTPGENEDPHLQAHKREKRVQTFPVVSPLGYDFASSLLPPLQGTSAPCPSPARAREIPLLSWPTCLSLGTLSHVSPPQKSSTKLKHRRGPQQRGHPAEETGLAKIPLLGEAPATTQRQWLSGEASSRLPVEGRQEQAASLPVPRGRADCSPSPGIRARPADFSFSPSTPRQVFPIAGSAAALRHRHPATKAAFYTLVLEIKENKTNNV